MRHCILTEKDEVYDTDVKDEALHTDGKDEVYDTDVKDEALHTDG